jgi:hypothetical protein
MGQEAGHGVGVPERKAMSSAAISDSMWKLSATSAIEFVI